MGWWERAMDAEEMADSFRIRVAVLEKELEDRKEIILKLLEMHEGLLVAGVAAMEANGPEDAAEAEGALKLWRGYAAGLRARMEDRVG